MLLLSFPILQKIIGASQPCKSHRQSKTLGRPETLTKKQRRKLAKRSISANIWSYSPSPILVGGCKLQLHPNPLTMTSVRASSRVGRFTEENPVCTNQTLTLQFPDSHPLCMENQISLLPHDNELFPELIP